MKNFGHNPAPQDPAAGRGIVVAETNSVEPSAGIVRRRAPRQPRQSTPAAVERGTQKHLKVVRIDESAPDEDACSAPQSRTCDGLEFWQRRARKHLRAADLSEIKSNLEGLVGLLAQWDLQERTEIESAVKLRGQHDPIPK